MTDPNSTLLSAATTAALPPVVYTTQITTRRYPDDTAAGAVSDWQSGIDLAVGYDEDATGTRIPIVQLNHLDISDGVAMQIVQSGGDDLLKMTFELDASPYCDVDNTLYLSGNMTFSLWGDSFTGSLSSTCQDQSGSGLYLWKGGTSAPDALSLQKRPQPIAALRAQALASKTS